MAVFFLQHTGKGKARYDRQGVVNHGRYVLRQSACSEIGARHAPIDYGQVLGWLGRLYDESRSNARVVDSVIVSLPRELDRGEQVKLLRSYLDLVTECRTPYLFVIHTDKPDNPHAHIIIRDADVQTGRRVAGLSKVGSSHRLRALWEAMCNVALRDRGLAISRHGKDSQEQRVLTVKAQGQVRSDALMRHQMPPAEATTRGVQGGQDSASQKGKRVAEVIQFPEPNSTGTIHYDLDDIQSVLTTETELTRLRAVKGQLQTLKADYKATQNQLDSVIKRMGDLAENVTKLTAAHANAAQTYADYQKWGRTVLRGFKVFGWKSPKRIRAERAQSNYRVATEVLEHTSNRLETVRKEHRILLQMAKKMERTEAELRAADISYGNDAELRDAEVILRSTLSMYAGRINEAQILHSQTKKDISPDEANRLRRVVAQEKGRDGYAH